MKTLQTSQQSVKYQPEKKGTSSSSQEVSSFDKAIEQLNIQRDPKDEQDAKQLIKLLGQILQYPDERLAEFHRESMRLGNYDLQKDRELINKKETKEQVLRAQQQKQFCPCCGFIRQQQQIKLVADIDKVANLGTSTLLYFRLFYVIGILLFIMTVIYSGFSLVTNVIAASNINNTGLIEVVDYLTISLSSKQLNPTTQNKQYYFISCWLGLLMVCLWILSFLCLQRTEIKKVDELDSDTSSAVDFSITMEKMPFDIKKQDLQKAFNEYYERVIKSDTDYPDYLKKRISIASINTGKPFQLNTENEKDQELQNLKKQIVETREQIINFVRQRQESSKFRTSKEVREKVYENFLSCKERIQKKITTIFEAKKKQADQNAEGHRTTIFVTFESSYNREILLRLHQKTILYMISRIFLFWKDDTSRFSFTHNGRLYQPVIRRAPEPEDVIWTNIGQTDCASYFKKFTTFTVTLVLLGICFAIVYGLTQAQQSANDNRVVSIAISITVSVVNVILGQVIRILTLMEKDYTTTYHQTSLAIKSILAQMVNTILIPVITAYKIKNNVYLASGLVDNIFMLSISLSILPPIMIYFDSWAIILWIIKKCKSTSDSKMHQNQKELNSYFEGPEFQVGYNSIYPVSLFAFVCFYVSLQPIISVFALLGFLLMYWVQKYLLFSRYKRPIPGTDFINVAVFRVTSFCPIIYSLGSLTWANFSPEGSPASALLPNLIALGISCILFVLPYKTLIKTCGTEKIIKEQLYDEERVFLPSDYDMLNPITQQKGIKQHDQYVKKKVQTLSKSITKQKQEQNAKKMEKNAQRKQLYQRNINNMGGDIMNVIGGAGQLPYQGGMNMFSSGQQYNPYQFMQQTMPMPMYGFAPPPTNFNPFFQQPAFFAPVNPMNPQIYPNPGVPMNVNAYQPRPNYPPQQMGFPAYGVNPAPNIIQPMNMGMPNQMMYPQYGFPNQNRGW